MDFLKASKIGQKQNKQTKNPTVLKKKRFFTSLILRLMYFVTYKYL